MRKRGKQDKQGLSRSELAAASIEVLESGSDPLIVEPLTDTTRRCRKALLGSSLVAFTLSWAGLVPERIEAFGISVEEVERANLLYVLALVTGYFLLAFFAYCYSDLMAYKVRVKKSQIMPGLPVRALKEQAEQLRKQPVDEASFRSSELTGTMSVMEHFRAVQDVHKAVKVRTVVDVFVPGIIGLAAIAASVQEAGRLPAVPVLIAFIVLVVAIVIALVLLSDKFRIFKMLRPMRKMNEELKEWVGLKKKFLSLDPNSWRARRIKRKLERSRFGLGRMDVEGNANDSSE